MGLTHTHAGGVEAGTEEVSVRCQPHPISSPPTEQSSSRLLHPPLLRPTCLSPPVLPGSAPSARRLKQSGVSRPNAQVLRPPGAWTCPHPQSLPGLFSPVAGCLAQPRRL